MARYPTVALTVGLALLFVFSPFQIENASGFEIGNPWRASSISPPVGFGPGRPIDVAWSIVPDGTNLPGDFLASGQANDPSSLIAFLDGIHGSGPGGTDFALRPWFDLFESSFQRWNELSGINYQYESNDDGNDQFGFGPNGEVGLRGDTRIGGHPLDSSVALAWAFPPFFW